MDKRKDSSLKTLFIIVGAIVCISTAAAFVYTFFKKHFKVTFECDGCDCCDGCDEFSDEVDNYEPICCDDEDESYEDVAVETPVDTEA